MSIMSETTTYYAVSNIKFNGNLYSRGDAIELDEKTAKQLINSGAVETTKPKVEKVVDNARVQTDEEKKKARKAKGQKSEETKAKERAAQSDADAKAEAEANAGGDDDDAPEGDDLDAMDFNEVRALAKSMDIKAAGKADDIKAAIRAKRAEGTETGDDL